jgi:D-alanine-D-alanine ligase
MFGGISPEHEVSVITGLQVIERIDREKYNPLALYISQEWLMYYYPNIKTRKDFTKGRSQLALLAQDRKGPYLKPQSPLGAKQYIYSAYLAFHGGLGESGHIPGMLESLNVPFTSSDITGAMLAQNKVLTKLVLKDAGLPTVEGIGVFSKEVLEHREETEKKIYSKLSLPVIVKPAHLGSSIGVKVARTEVELSKALLEAAYMDTEILIERLLIVLQNTRICQRSRRSNRGE